MPPLPLSRSLREWRRGEPRLRGKYNPSAGLDTRKLLQVTGSRGARRNSTQVREEEAEGKRGREGDGGVDGTRGPRLPRVAKRLEVPFM